VRPAGGDAGAEPVSDARVPTVDAETRRVARFFVDLLITVTADDPDDSADPGHEMVSLLRPLWEPCPDPGLPHAPPRLDAPDAALVAGFAYIATSLAELLAAERDQRCHDGASLVSVWRDLQVFMAAREPDASACSPSTTAVPDAPP
jgi:hypothetical protein